ncbi:MAG: hypothetical protein EOP86_09315 [Verrucomicrobiaceae bacterium]|nr:MAG: hypothetical protein EOP86_09315 [Verrucomicrobiaceae bacterium]
MSTLALQLEEALSQLDAEKRAELEAGVQLLIRRMAPSALEEPVSVSQEEWRRLIMELAGSVPDFPDDFEESPWETDREKIV